MNHVYTLPHASGVARIEECGSVERIAASPARYTLSRSNRGANLCIQCTWRLSKRYRCEDGTTRKE